MSQSDKARYYQALKAAGVQFTKHYREYSTDQLQQAYLKLNDGQDLPAPEQAVQQPLPEPQLEQAAPVDPEAAAFFGFEAPPQEQLSPPAAAPVAAKADPNEMPGQRLNSKAEDEPIRTDDDGRVWYQEEVLKPAYPKPRGRRVLKYLDPGAKEVTVKAGEYSETFEVAGDPANARPAEVKITLPSYQVGIYKDPRFPFKVVTYNGNNGFDLFDVQNFYGGAELVPPEIKRTYVENVLCYDIRSVVAAINAEFRQQQLTGGRARV